MTEDFEAKLWPKHPALGGQTGIGVTDGNGRTVWHTPERAREVVAQLSAGLALLAETQPEERS